MPAEIFDMFRKVDHFVQGILETNQVRHVGGYSKREPVLLQIRHQNWHQDLRERYAETSR